MTFSVRAYKIPFRDYFTRREQHEQRRASRARTPKGRVVRSIPKRFITVNHMYASARKSGTRFLSAEGKIYKEYISDRMAELDRERPPLVLDTYEVAYVFFMTYEMMYTKHGDLRKVDVGNMLKATEDAVFEYLLAEDSTVLGIHGYKTLTIDEEPKLLVLLKEADPDTISFGGRSYSFEELEYGSVL